MKYSEMLRVGEGIFDRESFNKNHPECKENERFFENMTVEEFEKFKSTNPSARKGEVAYTRQGKKASEAGATDLFPVFLAKEEREKIAE